MFLTIIPSGRLKINLLVSAPSVLLNIPYVALFILYKMLTQYHKTPMVILIINAGLVFLKRFTFRLETLRERTE